ncbi:hypothetical protein LU604_19610 [Erwinia tracheiphila]|uniref:hypothetical protein n=1 Tax=Erwinia tracheiphila TaxID=65700 RepID=UPI001F2844EB|nr:hypothetical protein [Erwinia tracheiphila]UIA82672.1 hypothetical protein LU604_19610 [Erwinia tracheiphila]
MARAVKVTFGRFAFALQGCLGALRLCTGRARLLMGLLNGWLFRSVYLKVFDR